MNRRDFLKIFGAAAAALGIGVSVAPAAPVARLSEAVISTMRYRNAARRADVIRLYAALNGEEYGIEMLVEDGLNNESSQEYLKHYFIRSLKEAGATSWRDGGELALE